MMNSLLNPWSTYLDPTPWLMNPFALTPAAPVRPGVAGKFTRALWSTRSGSLAYKLYIPGAYCGKPLPLIVMLHGCGQDADDFARGTDMNTLAEEMACIVAYPEQSGGARCWSWYDEAHHHRGQGEPALIAGVTRKIMADYAVDAGKVFVAGLSAGGAMAVVLGRTYPELFAAVGCHSGLAYACATDMSAALDAMRDGPSATSTGRGGRIGKMTVQVPVIVFHGDLDSTVHPRNSASVVEQCILDGTDIGACIMPMRAERGETTGRAFTRQIYRNEAGQVLAEQWLVHGTGHAWSGGNRRGSFTDANGPNASAEMLRFFLSTEPA